MNPEGTTTPSFRRWAWVGTAMAIAAFLIPDSQGTEFVAAGLAVVAVCTRAGSDQPVNGV